MQAGRSPFVIIDDLEQINNILKLIFYRHKERLDYLSVDR